MRVFKVASRRIRLISSIHKSISRLVLLFESLLFKEKVARISSELISSVDSQGKEMAQLLVQNEELKAKSSRAIRLSFERRQLMSDVELSSNENLKLQSEIDSLRVENELLKAKTAVTSQKECSKRPKCRVIIRTISKTDRAKESLDPTLYIFCFIVLFQMDTFRA